MTMGAATTACLALAAATAPLGRAALVGLEQAVGACRELSVDFIVLEGEANLLVLEDDIRADLAKIGVNVTLRELLKEDFNEAMVAGDFNMAFSETWGPPYDPHSYAASWSTPDEAYFSALNGLPPPNTKEVRHRPRGWPLAPASANQLLTALASARACIHCHRRVCSRARPGLGPEDRGRPHHRGRGCAPSWVD